LKVVNDNITTLYRIYFLGELSGNAPDICPAEDMEENLTIEKSRVETIEGIADIELTKAENSTSVEIKLTTDEGEEIETDIQLPENIKVEKLDDGSIKQTIKVDDDKSVVEMKTKPTGESTISIKVDEDKDSMSFKTIPGAKTFVDKKAGIVTHNEIGKNLVVIKADPKK
jgi:hypothetical protein